MQSTHRRTLITAMIATLLLASCGLLPVLAPVPTLAPGDYGATIAARQTKAVATASAQGFGAPLTPLPPTLQPGQAGGSPQFPVVTADAQCLRGPGQEFEVITTIAHGTQVSLLGRGAVPGWLIVREPTHGSPCWLQANVLQLPAGYDPSVLPPFNPPATVTITPAVTPTATP